MREAETDNSVIVDIDWFKKTKKQLEDEDKAIWDNQSLVWGMTFNFIEGKQLLRRSKYGKGWRSAPLPQSTDIQVYAYNLTGFYSDNIRAKWTNSSTDIRWRPTSDSDYSIGKAKASQRVDDYYSRKIYTNKFRQAEALFAQCGKYARYYYYTDEVKSYARREKTETQTVQFGEGSWFCPDCGEGGALDDLDLQGGAGGIDAATPMAELQNVTGAIDTGAIQEAAPESAEYSEPQISDMSGALGDGGTDTVSYQCPYCGSQNLDIQQPEPLEVEAVAGHEQIEVGDLVCETVPPFELKHDLNCLPQDSPYLIRRRRIRVSVLEAKFPFLKIRTAKGEHIPTQIGDSLKRSSADSRSKDDNDEPTVDFTQLWLDPCMYARKKAKDTIQTISGAVIPAGTLFSNVYPTGMYQCWIEGIDGVIELRNEHHKDFWVGQVYRPRAMSSLGSGIEDIVEGNRQYNLVMSIIYEQIRTSGSPATLFDERLLPNGVSAYLGSLSNIPVNMSALEDKRLPDAVHQLMPMPPTPQHFNLAQQLEYYCQKASRVTEFSGGLPNVNNKTATGAEITQSLAQSLFAPQLALKAEADRRGAEIILSLFKKYCIDEVYVSLAGKRGEVEGEWLKSADITTDIFAEVVPDSFLPQTNLERRERWDGFLQRAGGLQGLKIAMQESPEQVEQIAEIFDVDLASADYTAAAELARERLDQMKAAVPMLQIQMQQMPPTQMQQDPMTGEMIEVPVDPIAEAGKFLLDVLQPPIESEELGHLAAVQYYRSTLTEDEFKDAPKELRAGIKAAIYAHLDGLMAEAQITGKLAMAGQPMPPMMSEGPGPTNQNRDAKQMGGGQPAPMPMKAAA